MSEEREPYTVPGTSPGKTDALTLALAEMKELAKCEDYEYGHSRADDILCELLVQLGCEDIVDAYVKVHKWYA